MYIGARIKSSYRGAWGVLTLRGLGSELLRKFEAQSCDCCSPAGLLNSRVSLHRISRRATYILILSLDQLSVQLHSHRHTCYLHQCGHLFRVFMLSTWLGSFLLFNVDLSAPLLLACSPSTAVAAHPAQDECLTTRGIVKERSILLAVLFLTAVSESLRQAWYRHIWMCGT